MSIRGNGNLLDFSGMKKRDIIKAFNCKVRNEVASKVKIEMYGFAGSQISELYFKSQ